MKPNIIHGETRQSDKFRSVFLDGKEIIVTNENEKELLDTIKHRADKLERELKLKYASLVDIHFFRYKFWLSIKKKENCLFSRRNGHEGKLIFGYSVCLKLFNKTIL